MAKPGADGFQLSRRTVLGGVAGAAFTTAKLRGTEEKAARNAAEPEVSEWRPQWRLDRPKAALPNSYFWTWDHSTNWMWDDPGMLNYGCENRYLKRPETYLIDYRRLTDLAAGLGVRGVIIWGFLRDSHGGIDSAKRVVDYAASKNVAIMPGIGTNWYGGSYYEGDHPYCIDTFVKRYPEARLIGEQGNPRDRGLCPTHPKFVEWTQEGVQWLFREFNLEGANVENGDFVICYCPRCKKVQDGWPKDQPEFWGFQQLGYQPVLEALSKESKDKLITWATYNGFTKEAMKCEKPALFGKLPSDRIAQWTLSAMVRPHALPLTAYLDDGAPPESLANDAWPADVKPPAKRSVGFIHQGSQWGLPGRYCQIVSTIKEACLRAYRSGLEGVSIHGEVSNLYIPWALNYLAFSHFIHWPEDSLRQFGEKTLAPILGSEEEGIAFVESLAHWNSNSLTEQQKTDLAKRFYALSGQVSAGQHLDRWRFWAWLKQVAHGEQDPQTVSIF